MSGQQTGGQSAHSPGDDGSFYSNSWLLFPSELNVMTCDVEEEGQPASLRFTSALRRGSGHQIRAAESVDVS